VAGGTLITIEGLDGAGKTTLATALAGELQARGHRVQLLREPGGVEVSERVRALVKDPALTVAPRAEALLYAAARAQLVQQLLRPLLDEGSIVLLDRYVDSSLAYQGSGRRLPVEEIARLNDWATGGLRPDLTIVLDLPPESGLRRRARSLDRLEAEPTDFHDRVRAGFLRLAAEGDPERYLVLDASRPAADLSRAIQERVREMLPDPVPLTAEEITGSFPAIRE
jgi:dTMP kinase